MVLIPVCDVIAAFVWSFMECLWLSLGLLHSLSWQYSFCLQRAQLGPLFTSSTEFLEQPN